MPRGFGGGFGRGGYGMRRGGMGLLGMGGMGMGMGGSPLMTGLMAGGLGYLFGANSAQQNAQQISPQVQQVAPGYQPSQWQEVPPAAIAGPANTQLAQLKLLGDLHAAGTLTDEEFTREKERILRG